MRTKRWSSIPINSRNSSQVNLSRSKSHLILNLECYNKTLRTRALVLLEIRIRLRWCKLIIKRMLQWTQQELARQPHFKVKRQVVQQWETITNKNNRIFNSSTTKSSRKCRVISQLVIAKWLTKAFEILRIRWDSIMLLTSKTELSLSWHRYSNLLTLQNNLNKTTFWTDIETCWVTQRWLRRRHGYIMWHHLSMEKLRSQKHSFVQLRIWFRCEFQTLQARQVWPRCRSGYHIA